MVDVRPFAAHRPQDDLAEHVIAPPYDVLTFDEAKALAKNEKCFVRVTRSEVDCPEATDSHSDTAYNKARENLDLFIQKGWLKADDQETFYFYGQKMGTHQQVGILAACSVDEYDNNVIKKHEYTRPDKEDDRTHHMDVLDAQVGLVFLAYNRSDALATLTAEVTKAAPAWKVTTEDGVEHTLWPAPAARVQDIRDAFQKVPALYIADGHHRSAAASRIHKKRGDDVTKYFLAGVFPDDSLMVMAYNRIVHDLNGHTEAAFIAAIDERFDRSDVSDGEVKARGDVHMYLGAKWQKLSVKPGRVDQSDPVARLDVAVLQNELLEPLLGIKDPRTSTRITFAGGIRGPDYLKQQVDAGNAQVGFSMFPTPLSQLFEVADAGQVMPPKSTWFEPKLREGVCVRSLGTAS